MKRHIKSALQFIVVSVLAFLFNSCTHGDNCKLPVCSSFEGRWKCNGFKMRFRGGFIAPKILEIPHEKLTYPFDVSIDGCGFILEKSNGHSISGDVEFKSDSLFLQSERSGKYKFRLISFDHDSAVVRSEYLDFCIEHGDSTEFVHGRDVELSLFRYEK